MTGARSRSRYEYKYHLTGIESQQLLNRLASFVTRDEYSSQLAGYRVRSLYYDTNNLRAYQGKAEGDYTRIKLRVRTYSLDVQPNTMIKAELKVRQGTMITKHSAGCTYTDFLAFEKTGSWPMRDSNPVLSEFERLVRLYHMKPLVLVDYQRIAFKPRDRSNVRLTLDTCVQSASARTIYPELPYFRSVNRHGVILEIKTPDSDPPKWLSAIVRMHRLKAGPNSKYLSAIEHTQASISY